MPITVTKRDGTKEALDISKLNKVVVWACDGISGVNVSEIELKSQLQFYNNIKTSDIQETLIKAAVELITEDTPNYQFVAGRLVNYHLRKMIYNQPEPPHILEQLKKVAKLGYYDKELEGLYTEREWDRINSFIDHDRDFTLTYAAMEQFRGKYLIKNRVTDEYYETPQIAMMLIAATIFSNYPVNTRLKWVKNFYDAVSQFDLSLPTPIMAGVRTPQRQFSSCVLIDTGDSLDSINASASAIVKYVSQRAGIGINGGRIRAAGSAVRAGDTSHTGVTPFYRYLQSAVKSCSQGGVRGGSANLCFQWWHLEFEEMIVLKNNKGTHDNRLRQMDYCVQLNRLLYERLISGQDVSLFSPSEVPGLYEAFFADEAKFKEIYEKAERNTKIRRKTMGSKELMEQILTERKETGRVYIQNVDNVNQQGPFLPDVAPITMTNLCAEICLTTKPLNSLDDPDGEIALCTLMAINQGKIKHPSDYERVATLAVRALNEILDYQSYPVLAAKLATMNRRPLGIGITNLAYWLAKNNITYSNPDLEFIDEYAEAYSYYLIKASMELAKENHEPCPKFLETKWSKGLLPVDTYKKTMDELVPHNPKMDWETLRSDILVHGVYNSTLMAGMPCETSALISNSTNGFEPVPAIITSKQSKDGIYKQIVPESKKLGNKYELKYNQKSPKGYLSITLVFQKWMDQGISVNTTYNSDFFENNKIPMSVMMEDVVYFYRYGGKQLYYFNQDDHSGDEDLPGLDDEATDDEICESCAI
jgi:ribonucleoside-diphosphate reductase alpha chain